MMTEHSPAAASVPRPHLTVVPPGTRVVKRYGNRKLYDTVSSRYVKLEEVADLIREGTDVKVIEHRTGRDLTSAALAHIIFGEEVKGGSRSAGILAEVVRGGEAVPLGGADAFTAAAQAEAQHVAGAAAERRLEQLLNRAHRARARAGSMVSASDQAIARVARVASARVEVAHDVLDGLARARRDLARLAQRVDGLHERLREIER
jgi:polyhydroxyalkanoate synthesis repressor PhaR